MDEAVVRDGLKIIAEEVRNACDNVSQRSQSEVEPSNPVGIAQKI
jgi:hypothetical protein